MSELNQNEWTVFGDSNLDYFKIERDGGAESILRTFGTSPKEFTDISHAAHCVNSYQPLTRALKSMIDKVDKRVDYVSDPQMRDCADVARVLLHVLKKKEQEYA